MTIRLFDKGSARYRRLVWLEAVNEAWQEDRTLHFVDQISIAVLIRMHALQEWVVGRIHFRHLVNDRVVFGVKGGGSRGRGG